MRLTVIRNLPLLVIAAVLLATACKQRSRLSSDQLENEARYDAPYSEELFTVYPFAYNEHFLMNIADTSTWLHYVLGDRQDLAQREDFQEVFGALGESRGLWDNGREQFRFLMRSGANALQEVVAYDFYIKFKYSGPDERSKFLFQYPLHYRLLPQYAPNASRFFQVLISAGYYNQTRDKLSAQKCIRKTANQFALGEMNFSPTARPPELDCYKTDPQCCLVPEVNEKGIPQPLPLNMNKLPLKSWGLDHATEEVPFHLFRATLSTSTRELDWRTPFQMQCRFQDRFDVPLKEVSVGAPSSFRQLESNLTAKEKKRERQKEIIQEQINGIKKQMVDVEKSRKKPNEEGAEVHNANIEKFIKESRVRLLRLERFLEADSAEELLAIQREEAFEEGKGVKPVHSADSPNPGSICSKNQGSNVWPEKICGGSPALVGFGGLQKETRVVTMPTHDYVTPDLSRLKNERYFLKALDLMLPTDMSMSAGSIPAKHFSQIRVLFEGEHNSGAQNQGGGTGQEGGQSVGAAPAESDVLNKDGRYRMSGSEHISFLGAERVEEIKGFVDQKLQLEAKAKQQSQQAAKSKAPAKKTSFMIEELKKQAQERVRDQERMRLAVRPDGFVINPYENEAEYFCNFSQYPPAPFARFQGLVGASNNISKGHILEALAKALAATSLDPASSNILSIEKIDWLRRPPCTNGVCTGEVLYSLMPTFNPERK